MTHPTPRANQYQPPSLDRMEKRLHAADVPGQHLWVFTAMWLCAQPAAATDADVIKILDQENLVGLAGPGCFKCEQEYSPRIARRTCHGRLT